MSRSIIDEITPSRFRALFYERTAIGLCMLLSAAGACHHSPGADSTPAVTFPP